MDRSRIRFGEQALDTATGRSVWWDGYGWCYENPKEGREFDCSRETGKRVRKLTVGKRPGRLPLSYAQRRLWFIDRLEGGSTEYNVEGALRLRGELDCDALERAIQTIVERHESLRTHFVEVDGEPVQIIESTLRVEVPLQDLSGLEEATQREQVKEALRREGSEPFDLSSGPLVRVKLLRVGEREHILLRTMHHIVTDGWSEGIFNRELMELYEAFREGKGNPLKPLAVQYADFALWQREWLDSGVLDEGLCYWKEQLAGMPERLELPTDRARPAVRTFGAEVCQLSVAEELTTALRRLSQENQATLYMTLLSALAVVFSRYSGQDDIVMGSPIANRQDAQLEGMIGFFVNSLVMRVRLKKGISFRELMREVRQAALEAYRYQDIPFERLVEELSPERNLNTTPIFQVVFALQNTPWAAQQLKGLEAEPEWDGDLKVHFDLEVHAWEHEGRVWLDWVYNRDLFDRWRVEQMARHYMRVLEAVAADADRAIGQLDLLTAGERRQLLQEWNETGQEITRATLPELFEEQAKKTPDAVAVVYEEEQISYGELNERANRLAHYLVGMGVGDGSLVGICLDRSTEMIIAVLAILKAGAGCLSLDPSYPAERLAFIIQNSQPAVVLTKQELPKELTKTSISVVYINAQRRSIATHPAHNLRCHFGPENCAYVTYTSGSTGSPKGVVIPHRVLVNLAEWHLTPTSARVRTLQFASLNFDVSFQEIFATLHTGGILVLIPEPLRTDVRALGHFIEQNQVQRFHLPVMLLEKLAEEFCDKPAVLSCLRELMVGGEQLRTTQPIRDLFVKLRDCSLFNHYGPSESHVVTSFLLPENSSHWPRFPPLGRPIRNTKLYVLDPYMQPVPIGVVGELYIGGVCLAHGYLKRADLTAERFVPDMFSGNPGSRLYRTGDLGRYLLDGNIEFVGRNDFQLKIRGYRVELGEIEIALGKINGVKGCAVVCRTNQAGEKQLVAYLVLDQNISPTEETLRSNLRSILPGYMLPNTFIVLNEIPVNSNGKVDRNALPPAAFVSGEMYQAPRTSDEKILCSLFAEVLSLDRVGVYDDFFALGGHSLLASRLANRVREKMGVDLPIRTLFQAPTVSDLVWHLAQVKPGAVVRKQV